VESRGDRDQKQNASDVMLEDKKLVNTVLTHDHWPDDISTGVK